MRYLLYFSVIGFAGCSPVALCPPTPIQYTIGTGATDVDGNIYTSIVYNNGQEWLGENLRTTSFANGDPIQNVNDEHDWITLQPTEVGQCSYEGDAQYDAPYGKYYTWPTVTNPANLCPTGWHVPTLNDWVELLDYFGGTETCGHAMRTTGTQYWDAPNDCATNESGFSAVGSGLRDDISGGFFYLGGFAGWWSTQDTFVVSGQPWNDGDYGLSILVGENPEVDLDISAKGNGINVRCIKGAGPLPVFGVNQFNNSSGSLVVEIINYSEAPISEAGICWNITPNPTINNSPSQISSYGSNGILMGVAADLPINPVSGTTYYIKPFATNTFGIGYGTEETFIAP